MDDRQSWLKARQSGIGASDAAAALGISPWKTPFALWAEKTGLAEPQHLDDVEAVEWGRRLEHVIAEGYAERTGRQVDLWPPYHLVRSRLHDWMICTPDAVQHDQGRDGLVQIKTTGERHAADWEEAPPLHYQVQLQHELYVTDHDWGTLVVLIGGQRLKWFDIDRDDVFCEALVKALGEFWGHVESLTPPAVDGAPATKAALTRLHPADDGSVVTLPAEADEWARKYVQAKAAIKEAEEIAELCANQLRQAIGDASYGVTPGGMSFSWKTQQTHYEAREAYTATSRVLRHIKAVPNVRKGS